MSGGSVRQRPGYSLRDKLTLRSNSPKSESSTGHRSSSTFAGMSGERLIRYIALLHLSTQTPRSGRERLASLAARSGLSQVKPSARIVTASIDCSVSVATGAPVACCARTAGLKTTATAVRNIDPSSLFIATVPSSLPSRRLKSERARGTEAPRSVCYWRYQIRLSDRRTPAMVRRRCAATSCDRSLSGAANR